MNNSHIRSYVRRGSRMTAAQEKALETLWPHYGVTNNKLIDLNELFGRNAEKHLEIGFGMGDALIAMAHAHPEHDYLGIDVHRPGIATVFRELEISKLTNVRIFCGDVIDVMQQCLPMNCLDKVYLFFPDPWPKRRHHKRRLVQPRFTQLLAEKMKIGGYLHIATDWQDYADHILTLLENTVQFSNNIAPGQFAPRPIERPLTKFERRGQRLGYKIWDLQYRKQ